MRSGIFVSRTREKLGRTCDQIGRTLEPCSLTLTLTHTLSVCSSVQALSVGGWSRGVYVLV